MNAQPTAIEAALRMLHMPSDVYEIRMPKTPRAGTVSGYFDDAAKASAAIAPYDGKVPGVYVTMNPVNPDLLARASNRLRERATDTTSDKDVVSRRWLLIDVDYHRPSGISARDAELRQAGTVARQIRKYLENELYWPAGALVNSGNGAHLLYRIDLPNNDGARELVKSVLLALASRFDEGAVHVDTGVYNASRIVKVPGTVACKGENVAERPHRRSMILEQPDTFTPVPGALLQDLARSIAPTAATASQPGAGVSAPFNVPAFLERHNLRVRKNKDEGGSTLHELEACPFNPAHDQGEAFVFQLASGAVSAGCQHESCTWRWADLREKYEPGYLEKRSAYSHTEASCVQDGQRADHSQEPRPECGLNQTGVASDGACRLQVITAAELLNMTPERPEWVAEPIAARHCITDLVAGPKVGKTTFLLSLASAVAEGRLFMGQQTVKTGVLYLTEERGPTFRAAIERAGIVGENFRLVLRQAGAGWRWHEVVDAASRQALENGAGLLVVDTLADWAALAGDAENSSGAVLEALRPVQAAAAEGLAVLLVRHDRKGPAAELGEAGRGSNAAAGACDILMALRKTLGAGHDTRRRLDYLSRFDGLPPSQIIEWRPSERTYALLGTEADIEHRACRESLLELLPDEPATEKELLAAYREEDKPARSTLQRVIGELIDAGEVERTGEGKRGNPYKYKRAERCL